MNSKTTNQQLNFFQKYKENLIVLFILLAVFTVIFLINGCFPFGNNTILVSDSFLQIGPFFEYLFKVFRGEASIFYTNILGGGVEILPTLIYMLLNPFYLIAFLGGEAYCFQMFNFSLVAIMIFNAFVFLWFSKKHFKNISPFFRIIFCLLFTFSGYTLTNFGFITWLIYPALTLLLFDAFYTLSTKGKILKFTIILTWYVINCFYIGIFSNILLILLFCFYTFIIVPKNNRRFVFSKLFASYLIAICASIIILLPAIISVLGTNRASFDIIDIAKNTSLFNITNLLGLAIDGVIFVISILFCIKQFKLNPKSKISKFIICASVILLFPIIINISLQMINGGGFVGFPNRIYFPLSVLLAIATQIYFDKYVNLNGFEENKASSLLHKILYIFLTILMVAVLTIFIIFNFNDLGANTKNPLATNGGIVAFFAGTIFAFMLLTIFAYFFAKRKTLSKNIFKFNTLFIMILACLINVITFAGSAKTNLSDTLSAKSLTSHIQDNNASIRTLNCSLDLNNNSNLNVRNFNLFSSLIPSSISNAFSKLDYNSSITNVGPAANIGSLISDSLTGQKYYITSFEENRPYLKLIIKNDDFYLYENILASTGAILFDEAYEYDNSKDFMHNLELIKSSFGVSGTLFETITPTIQIYDEPDENVYTYKVVFTAQNDGIIYGNLNAIKIDKEHKKQYSLSESDIAFGCYNQINTLADLGFVNAGETYEFYLVCDGKPDKIIFTFLNYDVAEELCQKFQENDVNIYYNALGYRVSGMVLENRRLIIFNPNISGMNYLINNQEIESDDTINGFTSFYIKTNTFELIASYEVPYLNTWLIVSIVLIVAIILIIVLFKFKVFEKISKVIYGIFVVGSCGILSIFYFFSIILTFFGIIL